ncbi:FkbM family methyltransferase [Azospirillum brasilense]|uniref:FkbM family methyltransferase n=1 Tax=Azospirillum brasilense TaxID=192 RepID=A0A560AQC7_AZOBR|nr:FkbM family methyltransferase [Azospirillum brasilense]TWA62576.1 FkbM family methyltransferase [Azospirillum brasilense]
MGSATEFYTREYFTGRDPDGNKRHAAAPGVEEWEAGGLSPHHRALIDPIPLNGARVLEIGHGRAESARHLLLTGKANRYVGVDASEAALTLARETLKGYPAAQWSVHCDDALGFLTAQGFQGEFDAILMLDVIEHLSQTEVDALLPRLHAALRPGGYLVASIPPSGDLFTAPRGPRCNRFTEQRLHQELGNAGFFAIGASLFRRAPAAASRVKCTVVIPVGPGHQAHAQQAVNSVMAAAQSDPGPFTDFDCVAVDDTSGTKGRSKARNEGVREAASRGADWLFFLDADDLMMPDAFRQMTPHLDRADAVWGLILESVASQPGGDSVTGRIRLPQLPRVGTLDDLLLHDPFLTLQMGHFIRAAIALDTPFDESLDVGEDFDYYLRVWEKARCVKITTPLFLNRRGMHSTGPRSGNGADWRQSTEQVLARARQGRRLDPDSDAAIAVRNAATLDTRAWQRGFGAVDGSSLLSISRQFPFHGLLEFEPPIGDPIVLFDDNDDLVCMSLGWRGRYEPASLRLWQHLGTSARVVFDIGAYTGIYALAAARAAPMAHILAVEPVPANLARLEKNIRANGCDRVRAVHAAVLDRPGEVVLRQTAAKEFLTSGASILNRAPSEGCVEEAVPGITGGGLLDLVGETTVDLVKIDVEGAEALVLAGMRDLLERGGPDLLIECLDDDHAAQVDRILRPLGYRFHIIDDDAMRVEESERFVAANGMHSLNRWATRRDGAAAEALVRAAGLAFHKR